MNQSPNEASVEPPPRICVPVCERSIENLTKAIRHAAKRADLVEVRLDYLPSENIAAGLRLASKRAHRTPVILTLRPIEQGGRGEWNLAQRREFWGAHADEKGFFDWELDLVQSFANDDIDPSWYRIICSYHNFQGIPTDLNRIVQTMLATPARTLKLAVATREVSDNLALFRILNEVRPANRELIVIGMEEAGVISRILGPAWGSCLTYAAARAELATAPGQLTIDSLIDQYRIRSCNANTNIFGIMGWPTKHSLSPRMHNAALAEANLNAVFLPLPVRDCAAFLRRLIHPRTREWPLNWRGLSVTAPHKRTVMPLLDRVDAVAEEIGAVNTIVVQGEDLRGYNTDAEGFIAPLRSRFINLRGMRCAVLGAGGAARAAVWSLQRSGALTTVFARHPDRARLLGREFAADFDELAGASLSGFELVVNATPLGSRGELQDQTPVTATQLKGVRLVYDLVYNPAMTAFLRAGEAAGCSTIGGLEMLVAQAAVQFKLWTGKDAPVKLMQTAAKAKLNDGPAL